MILEILQFKPIFLHFVVWIGTNIQILAVTLSKNKKFHKACNFEVRCTTSQNERIWKNWHIYDSCCLLSEKIDFYLSNNQMSNQVHMFGKIKGIKIYCGYTLSTRNIKFKRSISSWVTLYIFLILLIFLLVTFWLPRFSMNIFSENMGRFSCK